MAAASFEGSRGRSPSQGSSGGVSGANDIGRVALFTRFHRTLYTTPPDAATRLLHTPDGGLCSGGCLSWKKYAPLMPSKSATSPTRSPASGSGIPEYPERPASNTLPRPLSIISGRSTGNRNKCSSTPACTLQPSWAGTSTLLPRDSEMNGSKRSKSRT